MAEQELSKLVRNGRVFDTEAAWLDARREYVSASDLSVLMGYSFKSEADLLLEKLDLAPPWEDTAAMWWGRHLEGPIIDAFGKLENAHAQPTHGFYTRGSLACTLDGLGYLRNENPHLPYIEWLTDKPPVLHLFSLEIKNSKSLGLKVPDYYWWQLQCQMWCTGLTRAVLMAKVRAFEARAWCVELDTDAMEAASERAREFMLEVESLR